MCLSVVYKTKQNVRKRDAITAYKIITTRDGFLGSIYRGGYKYVLGTVETGYPGFHGWLDRKAATGRYHYEDNGVGEEKLIVVKLWGRVRFGEQWEMKAVSATKMEIKSFRNLIRKRKA